jgi:rod shape-determining protein MreD
MQWVRFSVIVLLATILQNSLVDAIAVTSAGIKPDLLLILLVFFATHYDAREVVITSFALGFAADIAGPAAGLMGPQVISFGIVGSILCDLHRVLSIRKPIHRSLAIFFTGAVTSLFAHFLTFLRTSPEAYSIAAEAFGKPLYSAFVGPFLFLPVAWWMRISRRRRRRY